MVPARAQGVGLGKAILAGEHFVLDGTTAVAIALPSFRTKVRLERRVAGAGMELANPDDDLTQSDRAQTLAMLTRALDQANVPAHVSASIQSTVPLRRGFGSSAALAVAAVQAACSLAGRSPPTAQQWLDRARAIEALVHGTSSGLDPAAAMGHGAVAFRDGRMLRTITPPNTGDWARARWILLDLGPGPATGEVIARATAARKAMAADALDELVQRADGAARAAIQSLEAGDVAGVARAMRANAACLEEIAVVDGRMRAGMAAALAAGALAVKQTGAGLGGALLALAPDEETAHTVCDSVGDRVASTWIVETVA